MATWAKENAVVRLVVPTTMADDETSHTVKYQPLDGNAYPTGAVTATQGTSEGSRWFPSSDLNDEYHYDIYVDDIKVKRIHSPNAEPMIGG